MIRIKVAIKNSICYTMLDLMGKSETVSVTIDNVKSLKDTKLASIKGLIVNSELTLESNTVTANGARFTNASLLFNNVDFNLTEL